MTFNKKYKNYWHNDNEFIEENQMVDFSIITILHDIGMSNRQCVGAWKFSKSADGTRS